MSCSGCSFPKGFFLALVRRIVQWQISDHKNNAQIMSFCSINMRVVTVHFRQCIHPLHEMAYKYRHTAGRTHAHTSDTHSFSQESPHDNQDLNKQPAVACTKNGLLSEVKTETKPPVVSTFGSVCVRACVPPLYENGLSSLVMVHRNSPIL